MSPHQATNVASLNTLLPLMGQSLELLEINIQGISNMGKSLCHSLDRGDAEGWSHKNGYRLRLVLIYTVV